MSRTRVYFIEYFRRGKRLRQKTVFVEDREQARTLGANKLIERHKRYDSEYQEDVVRATCIGSGEYEEWTYGYWNKASMGHGSGYGWQSTKSTYRLPHPIDEARPK